MLNYLEIFRVVFFVFWFVLVYFMGGDFMVILRDDLGVLWVNFLIFIV